MPPVPMRATKVLTYDTRHLLPGADFEAKSERDARVLLAARKAERRRPEAKLDAPPLEVATKIATAFPAPPAADPIASEPSSGGAGEGGDDLKTVRAEYERIMGKKPFGGWTVEQLRSRMAEASAKS